MVNIRFRKIILLFSIFCLSNPYSLSAGWTNSLSDTFNSIFEDIKEHPAVAAGLVVAGVIATFGVQKFCGWWRRDARHIEQKQKLQTKIDTAIKPVQTKLEKEQKKHQEQQNKYSKKIEALTKKVGAQMKAKKQLRRQYLNKLKRYKLIKLKNQQLQQKTIKSIQEGPDPKTHIFAKAGLVSVGDAKFELIPNVPKCTIPTHADKKDEKTLMGSFLEVNEKNEGFDDFETETIDGIEFENVSNKKFESYKFTSKLVRPSLQKNGVMVLMCVHGTWSNNESFGGDLDKKATINIMNFAAMLAKSYDCAVKVVSFTWSGKLSLNQRKEAGEVLAEYFTNKNKSKFKNNVWVLTHSHGCNVVNWAAQFMKEKNCSYFFDKAIYMASPDSDKTDSDSKDKLRFYINTIYNFYGTGDCSQVLASFESKGTLKRKLQEEVTGQSVVYNIRVQENGKALNHVNIKTVIEYLPWLLHAIDTYYTCLFDLDANTFKKEDGTLLYPMVAIRDIGINQFPAVIRQNYLRALKFSSYQNERFKALYNNRSINNKASAIGRIFESMYSEVKSFINE